MSQVIFHGTGAARPGDGVGRRHVEGGRIASLAVGVVLLGGAAWVAAFRQQSWEFALLSKLNAYAGRSALFDRTVHALTSRELLQGVVLVALLWFLWFSTDSTVTRGRLLIGGVGAVLAGIVSRLAQIALPTHLRPLHTAALGFVPPIGVEPDALNRFNSFPSDHGAVFFALALVVARIRPGLGIAAFVWATIVDLGRVYDGFHYPSDIVGSVGLSILILTMLENTVTLRLARRVVTAEATWRPWFYMVAFVLSYLVATLFDDIRQIAAASAAVLLHHGTIPGGLTRAAGGAFDDAICLVRFFHGGRRRRPAGGCGEWTARMA